MLSTFYSNGKWKVYWNWLLSWQPNNSQLVNIVQSLSDFSPFPTTLRQCKGKKSWKGEINQSMLIAIKTCWLEWSGDDDKTYVLNN